MSNLCNHCLLSLTKVYFAMGRITKQELEILPKVRVCTRCLPLGSILTVVKVEKKA